MEQRETLTRQVQTLEDELRLAKGQMQQSMEVMATAPASSTGELTPRENLSSVSGGSRKSRWGRRGVNAHDEEQQSEEGAGGNRSRALSGKIELATVCRVSHCDFVQESLNRH